MEIRYIFYLLTTMKPKSGDKSKNRGRVHLTHGCENQIFSSSGPTHSQ